MRDELGAIGEVISSNELVRTTLNGVAKPRAVFIEAIVARENMPSWDRLWVTLYRRRPVEAYVHGGSSGNQEPEDGSLTSWCSQDIERDFYRFARF